MVRLSTRFLDKFLFANGSGDMRPKDIVGAWVDAFNRADAEALAAFYEDNAINHPGCRGTGRGPRGYS
jgi:hypothetical protein